MDKDYHDFALTLRVIAMHYHVSKSTVLKWIKDDMLRAFRLPSGHYRVDKEDFRDFLERYHMPIREELFGSESKKEGGDR